MYTLPAQSLILKRQKMTNLDKIEKQEKYKMDPEKFIIKETPRTIIEKLDESIEARQKEFKVKMVTSCILNGLDFDSFMSNADNYIKKKMSEVEAKGRKFDSSPANCQL